MRTESKLLRVSWNPNDMNGEHLSPKTRELLDKPIEERSIPELSWKKSVFVQYFSSSRS